MLTKTTIAILTNVQPTPTTAMSTAHVLIQMVRSHAHVIQGTRAMVQIVQMMTNALIIRTVTTMQIVQTRPDLLLAHVNPVSLEMVSHALIWMSAVILLGIIVTPMQIVQTHTEIIHAPVKMATLEMVLHALILMSVCQAMTVIGLKPVKTRMVLSYVYVSRQLVEKGVKIRTDCTRLVWVRLVCCV